MRTNVRWSVFLYRRRQRAARWSKLAIAGLAAVSLAACSFWPLEQVTSLSPAVGADMVGYNRATGDASDPILLANVLRAEYRAPLDLGQLSSLSGTLSLQGTLGFTLPFGHGASSGKPNNAQNVAMPSVMGSTTPIYTYTPLDTQGFILSILQPVQGSYVLTQWQAGVSREMLLMLFVKEIDFPADANYQNTYHVYTKRYINDPDDPARLIAFRNVVGKMLEAGAELKAIDILDPIGPPFSLHASVSTTDSTHATTTSPATMSDQTGFGLITSQNDYQYHVGNAPKEKLPDAGQLYRVYAGQVELCVDKKKMDDAGYHVPQLGEKGFEIPNELRGEFQKPEGTKLLSQETNALAVKGATGANLMMMMGRHRHRRTVTR